MKLQLTKENFKQAELAKQGLGSTGKKYDKFWADSLNDIDHGGSLLGWTNKRIKFCEKKIAEGDDKDKYVARIFGYYCKFIKDFGDFYFGEKKQRTITKSEMGNIREFQTALEEKYGFNTEMTHSFDKVSIDLDKEKRGGYIIEDDSFIILNEDMTQMTKEQSEEIINKTIEKIENDKKEKEKDIDAKNKFVDLKEKVQKSNKKSRLDILKNLKEAKEKENAVKGKEENTSKEVSENVGEKIEQIKVEEASTDIKEKKEQNNIEENAKIAKILSDNKKQKAVVDSLIDKVNTTEYLKQNDNYMTEVKDSINNYFTSSFSLNGNKISEIFDASKNTFRNQNFINKFDSLMVDINNSINELDNKVNVLNSQTEGLSEIIGDVNKTIEDRQKSFDDNYFSKLTNKSNDVKIAAKNASSKALNLYIASKQQINKRGIFSKIFNRANNRLEDQRLNDLKGMMKDKLGFTDSAFEKIDKAIKNPKLMEDLEINYSKNNLNNDFIDKLENKKLSSLIDMSINKVKDVKTEFKVEESEIEKFKENEISIS